MTGQRTAVGVAWRDCLIDLFGAAGEVLPAE
jgi:hypothetical protein